jgi:hypothetical protein
MLKLLAKQRTTHMEKHKGALLHSSEFIWSMLVVHCNIEPAPRRALNAHNHKSGTMQASELNRSIVVPLPVVIPTIPQV